MTMNYTLENKPKFVYGQTVYVDMKAMGVGDGYLQGKIVGLATRHIIDHWLVEFERDFGSTYPYRVVSVQHTFIKHGK